HTMSILVCLGSLLGICGIYPQLTEFAGFGATLPISSFGNTLVEGAMAGAAKSGFWGLFTGILTDVSAGITGAVVFGFVIAICFKPRL
ncbi:MAG: SpoVA/SpoVAEb family sporulation membrane protein, partial [Clostridiales bacterium]